MRSKFVILVFLLICVQMLLISSTAVSASTATIECNSISTDGTMGDSSSGGPSISADGRYVAFESVAGNLVANGSSLNQIYLRDRAIPSNTVMVSVNQNGNPGNNRSYVPSISADGRSVAFVSYATDLVDGDSNGYGDIFVRDLTTNTTELISVASNGNQANGDSIWAAVSADGRYVAFQSSATNLANDANNGDVNIYVRDRKMNTTELISVSTDGEIGNGDSITPFISCDGRYVTFSSLATNFTSSATNGSYQVYVRDRLGSTTETVSKNGQGSLGNADSSAPCISTDGRYVAFVSLSSNLINSVTGSMVYVYDRQDNTIELVSKDNNGNPANADSTFSGLAISPDGRYVSFDSAASNLIGEDSSDNYDVYVRDRLNGTTEMVSANDGGLSEPGNGDSWYPTMSVDGRFISFNSYSNNFTPNDLNNDCDVFLRDRGTDGLPLNPEVDILTPTTAPAYSTQSSTVDIQGIAIGAQSLTGVTWANTTTGTTGSCAGSAYWIASDIPIQPGANTIVITATDNTTHTGSATLIVNAPGGDTDTTLPSVTINVPSTNPYSTTNSTLDIAGVASDNVGVTSVAWANSAGGSGTCTGTTSWSVHNVSLQLGANTITITASDAAGNKGVATITVNYQSIDNIHPTVTITTPTSSGTYNCNTPTLAIGGTASDNIGVQSVSWLNSAGGSGICTGSNSWSANISLHPGLNVITVTAKDAANNTGTASLTVNYADSTVFPSITIAVPTNGSTYSTNDQSLKISGTASDTIGLYAVAWSNDRGGSGVCTGTANWSQTGITLQPGKNVITVTASNTSNNTKSTELTVIYYDTSTVKWKTGTAMVSLPIIPYTSDPKPLVQFKGSYWYAYRPNIPAYAGYSDTYSWFNDYAATPQSTPGRGFWAKFDVDVTVPVGGLLDQTQQATIHLLPGWNIIGQPYVNAVKWNLNAIKVKDVNQNVLPLGSTLQDCVSDFAWGWKQNSQNPSTGAYYAIYDAQIIPGVVDQLTPWQAFWILARKECDLIIPPPGL